MIGQLLSPLYCPSGYSPCFFRRCATRRQTRASSSSARTAISPSSSLVVIFSAKSRIRFSSDIYTCPKGWFAYSLEALSIRTVRYSFHQEKRRPYTLSRELMRHPAGHSAPDYWTRRPEGIVLFVPRCPSHTFRRFIRNRPGSCHRKHHRRFRQTPFVNACAPIMKSARIRRVPLSRCFRRRSAYA